MDEIYTHLSIRNIELNLMYIIIKVSNKQSIVKEHNYYTTQQLPGSVAIACPVILLLFSVPLIHTTLWT